MFKNLWNISTPTDRASPPSCCSSPTSALALSIQPRPRGSANRGSTRNAQRGSAPRRDNKRKSAWRPMTIDRPPGKHTTMLAVRRGWRRGASCRTVVHEGDGRRTLHVRIHGDEYRGRRPASSSSRSPTGGTDSLCGTAASRRSPNPPVSAGRSPVPLDNADITPRISPGKADSNSRGAQSPPARGHDITSWRTATRSSTFTPRRDSRSAELRAPNQLS